MVPTEIDTLPAASRLDRLRTWVDTVAAPAFERRSLLLYGLMLLGFLGLFAAAARFLTLEPDEAWILLSTAHAFGAPLSAAIEAGQPTITTGGPYLLAHGPLARITMDVFAHRLVSLVAAGLLLAVVYCAARWMDHPRWRAAGAAALFAAAPGFFLQAGLATGEVIAVLFLVAGVLYWVGTDAGMFKRTALAGLLIGSACAARVNCVAALPALVLFALVAPKTGRGPVGRSIALACVSAVVAGLSAAIYYFAEHDPGTDAYVGKATGLGESSKSFGTLIRAIDIANAYIPLLLIAGVTVGWMSLRFSGRTAGLGNAKARDASGVLLFIGVTMLAAWVLIAPFPHLRYLWPSVACIWLAGIFLLLEAWRHVRSPVVSLGLHALVIVVSMPALLDGMLAVTQGESSLLVHHAMGMTPQHPMGRSEQFRAAADQRALAAFVARQPRATRFVALLPFFAYSITYLSGREVLKASETSGAGRILLMLPSDHAIARPDPGFGRWLHTYAIPVFRSGDVAAFRIADGAPPPVTRLIYPGQNDIY